MRTKKVPPPVWYTENGKGSAVTKSHRDVINFSTGCQVAEVLYGI